MLEVGIKFFLGMDEVTGEEGRECCFWEKNELCAEFGGYLEECDHAREGF